MWSEANEITLPAKGNMRTVAAKYLFSAWAYFIFSVEVDHLSTNRTLHAQHDTCTYTRTHTKTNSEEEVSGDMESSDTRFSGLRLVTTRFVQEIKTLLANPTVLYMTQTGLFVLFVVQKYFKTPKIVV